MSYWWVASAALSAVGAINSASSANQQNQSQLAMNQYNANAQFNVSMSNIDSMLTLANINAELGTAAAGMQFGIADMQMQAGINQAQLTQQTAELNAGIINSTTQYNNALLDEEMSLMWEAMDLDLTHLANQRAVERGQIKAQQSASGTIMGQDSNADVIIDQKTQEALDELVVRHQADINAAGIRNQQAQNSWQGAAAVTKTLWEGNMSATIAMQNAAIQAQSTAAGGVSQILQSQMNLIGANIQAGADRTSANYALQSGLYGANTQYSQNNNQIRSNFVTGLFSSASTAIQGYEQSTTVTPTNTNIFGSGGGQTTIPFSSGSANLSVPSTNYQFGSGYQSNVSLSSPGSSLITS